MTFTTDFLNPGLLIRSMRRARPHALKRAGVCVCVCPSCLWRFVRVIWLKIDNVHTHFIGLH